MPILFDDDSKESVKVTNVLKCDFSQSWTLSFKNFPGEHALGPLSWRSGYCYLNKRQCKLNQSKDCSFVERVAKNFP